MKSLIILIAILAMMIIFAINGTRRRSQQGINKKKFYSRDSIISTAIVILFLLIDPTLFRSPDPNVIGVGITIPIVILVLIMTLFIIPLLVSLSYRNNDHVTNQAAREEFNGFPVAYLPSDRVEFRWFIIYIIAGVLFEELVCRQFLMYTLNDVTGLKGDSLIFITAGIFAIGHLYQGWKGIVSSFVLSLLLGKIFLQLGTIWVPVGLHLLFNLNITVLAGKRIKREIHHTGS